MTNNREVPQDAAMTNEGKYSELDLTADDLNILRWASVLYFVSYPLVFVAGAIAGWFFL